MPNFILTTSCPGQCPWCFAEPELKVYRAKGISEMDWADFLSLVNMCERSNIHSIALLGGEPTLHSRFIDILELLDSRGFTINVSSCGICPTGLVDSIARLKLTKTKFGLNTTRIFDYPDAVREKVLYYFSQIPNVVGISYTVTSRDIMENSLSPIFDRIALLKKFSIRQHITFQIAVPSGGNQEYVPFKNYPKMFYRLLEWFKILSKNGFSYNIDCHCIPKCVLPSDVEIPFQVRSKCNYFPIDIGPGLDIWPCFPLASLRANLRDFECFEEVSDFFISQASSIPLRYESGCNDCTEWIENKCDGGCRGFQHLRQ